MTWPPAQLGSQLLANCIVKPGEQYDQYDVPIVVTSTNAGQIIEGTRRGESGPAFVEKTLAELGPSAFEETEAQGQTNVFCIGRNGSIVVVELRNASVKADEQVASAVEVAKALQQLST